MTTNAFVSALTASGHRPVLYELLPPPEDAKPEDRREFLRIIEKLLGDVHVDAINVPEVRNEAGQTSAKGAYTVGKGDPRPFARELCQYFPHIPVIVNHVVVSDPMDVLQRWVGESYDQFGLRALIVVGGESRHVRYVGPTVRQAAEWITRKFNRTVVADPLVVGGITIPSRRHTEQTRDEPERLLNKARSGMDFFTSQVIYESEAMKRLLEDYDTACRNAGASPKRIMISFAPISSKKDVQFLRWLGVDIPGAVEQKLEEGWIGMGWRSVEICQAVLQDILDFVSARNIAVPLGINVEHIMKYNVELSKELLVHLSKQLNA